MVEANSDGSGGGWDDEWEEAQENIYLEEPGLDRQGSSMQDSSNIYSTKARKDINFVDSQTIVRLLAQRVEQV